jgi:type IV pilus assembly protein PilV
MKPFPPPSPPSNAGFSLLEILISIVIIALGLLGLAGMQVRMQQAEFESYQRSQALVLLYDMVERIQAHRIAARNCFAFTTNTTDGTPYVGTGATAAGGCASGGTAADNTMANNSIAEWDGLLDGAAETSGGAAVGAMVGARGCVNYDAASEFAAQPGTGIYTVMVAWQGQAQTAAPTNADGTTIHCADNLYGLETQRRVVSTSFRLAQLD